MTAVVVVLVFADNADVAATAGALAQSDLRAEGVESVHLVTGDRAEDVIRAAVGG